MQLENNTPRAAHPVFNQKYEILKSLGEGNTSKVYLGKLIGTEQYAAIKILKEEFLRRDNDSIVSVHNEITILKNLQHQGIINMHEYGDAGQVVKPSGRVIDNLVYIVMEFVQGGLLFDLCQTMGAILLLTLQGVRSSVGGSDFSFTRCSTQSSTCTAARLSTET